MRRDYLQAPQLASSTMTNSATHGQPWPVFFDSPPVPTAPFFHAFRLRNRFRPALLSARSMYPFTSRRSQKRPNVPFPQPHAEGPLLPHHGRIGRDNRPSPQPQQLPPRTPSALPPSQPPQFPAVPCFSLQKEPTMRERLLPDSDQTNRYILIDPHPEI